MITIIVLAVTVLLALCLVSVSPILAVILPFLVLDVMLFRCIFRRFRRKKKEEA